MIPIVLINEIETEAFQEHEEEEQIIPSDKAEEIVHAKILRANLRKYYHITLLISLSTYYKFQSSLMIKVDSPAHSINIPPSKIPCIACGPMRVCVKKFNPPIDAMI